MGTFTDSELLIMSLYVLNLKYGPAVEWENKEKLEWNLYIQSMMFLGDFRQIDE